MCAAPSPPARRRADNEDSANSQFFIVFQPRLTLDHKYTVFGRVIEGAWTIVDAIQRGEPPANPTKILHAYYRLGQSPGLCRAAARARSGCANACR